MRAAEAAVFASGTTVETLIERAGLAVARETLRLSAGRPILMLAGPGNNGRDALVAARLLREWGQDVTIGVEAGGRAEAAQRFADAGAGVFPLAEAPPRAVLVDGLFGTGVTRRLDRECASALARLVGAADLVLAIDLPSGLDADSGRELGAVRCDATLALGALKPGHLLSDGIALCGYLLLADIGVPVPHRWTSLARPRIAPPAPGVHKFDRGLVVVVEGAMPGAARLASQAAAAGGAGYVIHAGAEAPAGLWHAIVHRRVDGASDLARLLEDARVGAVVIGPGLGRDAKAQALVDAAVASDRRVVIDGDALHLIDPDRLAAREADTVLTPHGGEFAAVFAPAGRDKIADSLAAAARARCTIVHKGADTVIARPDGTAVIASDASGWLSTAGSGDVLAGLVAARCAAGSDPEQAVWLHGRAAWHAGPAFPADRLASAIPAAIDACR